ncbi:uncharacterized protein K489DRAFT_383551 [Dissoconium aciculare CBS 342.82]|uniref:Uncharacterized protein n=1 Tax=Dissoconium aciculare CBS 342.82 TaxID=1314786 RepID=A0A6J3LXH7_9PEZI|nr:uncharacterized protein K489DRAFT_383551 [Dissoconium aciculare CBS 342.82]KAF1819999.1 hypothetical protein K489DRAFT_383551 [Dissoconium aciculare CBS 342.82]
MAEYALALFEAAKKQFGDLFSGLSKLTWEQAGPPIIGYVKTHPSTTALQLATFLAVVFPAIVTAPTFPVLGLGSLGPVKGRFHPFSRPILLFLAVPHRLSRCDFRTSSVIRL